MDIELIEIESIEVFPLATDAVEVVYQSCDLNNIFIDFLEKEIIENNWKFLTKMVDDELTQDGKEEWRRFQKNILSQPFHHRLSTELALNLLKTIDLAYIAKYGIEYRVPLKDYSEKGLLRHYRFWCCFMREKEILAVLIEHLGER